MERVYVTVTPLGSLERDVAMWENKQKDVGRQFVAFCPNNGMQYPLNQRKWFREQLKYLHRARTGRAPTPSYDALHYSGTGQRRDTFWTIIPFPKASRPKTDHQKCREGLWVPPTSCSMMHDEKMGQRMSFESVCRPFPGKYKPSSMPFLKGSVSPLSVPAPL